MIGTFPFSSQTYPFAQSPHGPFGYGSAVQPFGQQSQLGGLPLPQVVQAIAQQLGQVNQLNQQQSQLLQQLIQIVPQQLQQIQQFLQILPQLIHQQSQQGQPVGPGLGNFNPWQLQFSGTPTWSAPVGGTNLGFTPLGGQSVPVM